MKTPRKSKIFYNYLTFVLPFIVVSILATGIMLSWTNYRYFKKTIAQDYANIIKSSGGEIRLFMVQALQGLKTLSRVLQAVKPDPWQQRIALAAFNHENEHFLSVSLISDKGEPLATTGWDKGDVAAGEQDLLQKALAGRDAVSGVRLTKDRLPFVNMAVPVPAMGKVRTVLWAVVDLKYIWDILEGIRIGRTGQVYIMDQSGRLIAHREIDKVVAPAPAEKPEIFEKAVRSDVPVSWTEHDQGARFYCLGYYVTDFNWMIVLRQPLPEIYQYLFKNIYLSVFVIAIVCFAAIFAGYYRIKRIVTPIETMHRQVQKIGKGDLDSKITIRSEDEIGELAQAFNAMTCSLKEVIQREIDTAKDLAHARNLAVLGTTAGKVTHEVGNLLNNVGMALTALKREALSQQGEKALGSMERESDRVRVFIRDFLQFAKMPEVHPAEVSLGFIVQEVIDAHRPNAEERGIALQFHWC